VLDPAEFGTHSLRRTKAAATRGLRRSKFAIHWRTRQRASDGPKPCLDVARRFHRSIAVAAAVAPVAVVVDQGIGCGGAEDAEGNPLSVPPVAVPVTMSAPVGMAVVIAVMGAGMAVAAGFRSGNGYRERHRRSQEGGCESSADISSPFLCRSPSGSAAGALTHAIGTPDRPGRFSRK